MQQPSRRAPVSYKQPHAINPVSISVCLILGAMVYLAYCYWPTIRLKSNAKSEMQDALIQLYRLNLRQDKHTLRNKETLEKTLRANLLKVGVTDPDLQLLVDMNPKTVSLETRFVSSFELVGLDKRYPINHHMRVETDAARVDW